MPDPKELFVVHAVTRDGIADDINDYISGYNDETPHPNALKPDDERLTNEFCREYAAEIGTIDQDDDEAECEIISEFAARLGLHSPDEG